MGDFDYNRWLFEFKGKYGIGNVFWLDDIDNGEGGVSMLDFLDKLWKFFIRKVKIFVKVFSFYRFLNFFVF